MRYRSPSTRLIMTLISASIAAQCTAEGSLLDEQARIELEESIEATQRNRTFGLSEYCLTVDCMKHCPGLTSPRMGDPTRNLERPVSESVLEPLKQVLGMYRLCGILRS